MPDGTDAVPEPLRDLLLSRLPDSGLTPAAQELIRELLPDTPPGGTGRAGPVYLRSVTATGWRGVGPATMLELRPEPGLTVIAGRNGSGKSSFAEAAEMALTGDNFRWQGRTQVWKQGWRNLHHGAEPQVSVDLTFGDGSAPVTVRRAWHGEQLADSTTVVETPGAPAELTDVIDPEELSLYRPFLPYSELGALINGPLSALHDALSEILGLELLSDTDANARELAKSLNDTVKARDSLTTTVLRELTELNDPRAAEVAAALGGRRPDLDRVRALLKGHTVADGNALARLRRLGAVEAPDRQAVTAAVKRLRVAAADAEDARHSSAEDARRLIGLLEEALLHRRRHPEAVDCPVCGAQGRLDQRWAESARAQVDRLEDEAAEALSARVELAAALRDLHDLVHPVPAWLQDDEPALAAIWRDWAACRAIQDPRELADAAERAEAVLGDACLQTREDAALRLAEQDGRWQSMAGRVAAWLRQAEAAEAAEDRSKLVKAVRAWLRKVTDELRDARLKPFADQSQAVWKLLCERSSVTLGSISLAGASNQRKVVLDVAVDAIDAPAFSVMSQGELHSLALSLFMPRATHPSSPFNFLVIDDPVQSMDPEKVEGLAKVLDLYARHRQVVVFTHDTRLEEAIVRLGITATIKRVSRQTDSVVHLVPVSDPVSQALDEARAIALDVNLPQDVADRVLPAMCRVALEAAFLEAARKTLRAAGVGRRAAARLARPLGGARRGARHHRRRTRALGEGADQAGQRGVAPGGGACRRPQGAGPAHRAAREGGAGTMTLPTSGLLAAADELLNPPTEVVHTLAPGPRARAAAVLLRLALDETLDGFWGGITTNMSRNGRTRMLSLQWYVRPSVARQWYTVWSSLSAACHHHTYELPPTPAEVRAWHQDVTELLEVLPSARL